MTSPLTTSIITDSHPRMDVPRALTRTRLRGASPLVRQAATVDCDATKVVRAASWAVRKASAKKGADGNLTVILSVRKTSAVFIASGNNGKIPIKSANTVRKTVSVFRQRHFPDGLTALYAGATKEPPLGVDPLKGGPHPLGQIEEHPEA